MISESRYPRLLTRSSNQNLLKKRQQGYNFYNYNCWRDWPAISNCHQTSIWTHLVLEYQEDYQGLANGNNRGLSPALHRKVVSTYHKLQPWQWQMAKQLAPLNFVPWFFLFPPSFLFFVLRLCCNGGLLCIEVLDNHSFGKTYCAL